jgi:hypothetical protein
MTTKNVLEYEGPELTEQEETGARLLIEVAQLEKGIERLPDTPAVAELRRQIRKLIRGRSRITGSLEKPAAHKDCGFALSRSDTYRIAAPRGQTTDKKCRETQVGTTQESRWNSAAPSGRFEPPTPGLGNRPGAFR